MDRFEGVTLFFYLKSENCFSSVKSFSGAKFEVAEEKGQA